MRNIPEVFVIKDYYRQASFTQAIASSIGDYWAAHSKAEHLMFSFHGVPQAYADNGDPYYQQCLDTSAAVISHLNLPSETVSTCFQSRLGKAKWLTPYTDKTIIALAQSGVKTLDVVCPSFSVDCLETLEEIALQNAELFIEHGGETLNLIPCLNDTDPHIQMMKSITEPLVLS